MNVVNWMERACDVWYYPYEGAWLFAGRCALPLGFIILTFKIIKGALFDSAPPDVDAVNKPKNKPADPRMNAAKRAVATAVAHKAKDRRDDEKDNPLEPLEEVDFQDSLEDFEDLGGQE